MQRTSGNKGRALLKQAATFAEALRLRMGEEQLTQRQLAEAIGVSESRVSRWMAGGLPNDRNLVLAADWLGVTPEDLFHFLRRQRAAIGPDTRTTSERLADMQRTLDDVQAQVERMRGLLERLGIDGQGSAQAS